MRRRSLAALALGAKTLALGGVFAGAAVSAVVLHADLPATRRLVVASVNDALAPLFQGRLVIGELKELSLGTTGHARVAQAEVFDPEKNRVIFARGIDARIDLVRLVRSIVTGSTPDVVIEHARIDGGEVLVDYDANGEIGIARAFLPVPSTTPAKVEAPSSAVPTEDVRLSIADAYVHHAWVHGNIVAPRLDADGDEIRAKVFIFDNRLTVSVSQVIAKVRSPRVPGQSGDVRGGATGEIGVPLSASRADIVMHWDFLGDAAGIPLKAHVGLEKDRLVAVADVTPTDPALVRKAFPMLPLMQTVELHAKAEGAMTQPLTITATGRIGEGAFKADGELGIGDNQPFRLDADLTRLDGAAFTAPSSQVTGHVHAEGAITNGAPSGTFTVVTDRSSTVVGQPAPALDAKGSFDAQRVDATFTATEPGVTASGKIAVRIPEQTVTLDVRAHAKELRNVARAPGLASGSATVQATATVDLARATIAGEIVADGSGVARSPASAESVHAAATISGPVAGPVLDVTASATQVRLSAEGGAGGARKEPLTYPNATARARVFLVPTPRITDAEVRIEPPVAKGGAAPNAAPNAVPNAAAKSEVVVATASEIRFGAGGVGIRGGRVSGLGGTIESDIRIEGRALTLRVKGDDVDIHRLAGLTGIRQLELLPESSRASLDVDIEGDESRAEGHADITITSKEGIGGSLHAVASGRHVSGSGRVELGTLGWIALPRAEINLPGGPTVKNLKRATGALDLQGEIDLSQGAALFGGESIEQVTGRASFSARIERGDPENLPTVYATALTRDLDVILNQDGTSVHIGGVDGSVHVGYDGATDETELSLLTWDKKGILASSDLKARVPLVAWATGARRVDRSALGALEIGGVIDLKRREAADLPGMFARPDLVGTVQAHAEIGGSIADPRVTLVATADAMTERVHVAGARYAPIDAVLEARWDGSDVVAALRVDENERARRRNKPDRTDKNGAPRIERRTGHVRGLVIARVPAADLLAGRPVAWNASAELDVADLELAPLPIPMNLRGALTARVKLRDLAHTPVLVGHAHVEDLGVAGVLVKNGDFDVDAHDGALLATADVRQKDGGSAIVKIDSSALEWHGTQVAWNDAKPTHFTYQLDRVRMTLLRPFLRRSIPEIDGRIDGRGSATIDAGQQVFEGGITVSGGRLYVNALGEEIADVSAVARFERDGGFRIQDAKGTIGTGKLSASVAGRMKGLRFEAAEAVVVVASKDGVPLSAEGATFAEATGEVKISAKMAPDSNALAVTVAVPRAEITIPDRTTQNLQSLEPDATIDIGIRRPDGQLSAPELRTGAARRQREAAAAAASGDAPSTAKPLTARFTVTLGDDVALEGRGLKLYLGGRTVVDVAEELAVAGQISLRNGGTIDVQGRKFVVDRGTVTFVGDEDPSNPIVIAAAYWTAPDRTRVWVEFNGPLKTGKLTLRSEPPYSKNEILSILLFGRADPNQSRAGDARPSNAQQGVALGTSIASSGLNQALGDLDEDFELEQDRTSANRVRTKLGYRLRRNLKVQIGYASGFSVREPDTTYLFLEWQFIPKWSLIGTRGDRGTSILDVVFQHRY